jgi:hypothetical protein
MAARRVHPTRRAHQRARVPLFTLSSAVKQPRTYQGRWVMLRGAATEQDSESGSTTIVIKETSLRGGITHDVRDGDQYSGASGWSGGFTVQRMHAKTNNDHTETGVTIVAKLPEVDPFIEPGKDFIFFGRFDGLRPGSNSMPVAMVTLAGYFRPNDLMLQ